MACLSMARLRFGVVSESAREGRAWLDFARQIEHSGIDVLLRDHFSAAAFARDVITENVVHRLGSTHSRRQAERLAA
jgi:hypothetical protein